MAVDFISIRTGRLPVVEVTFPAELVIADFERAFEVYAQLAGEHDTLIFRTDLRAVNMSFMSAKRRRDMAAVFTRYAPVILPVFVGDARIVANEAIRGLATAFDWLTGRPWPTASFTSAADADAWIDKQLARAASSPRLVASAPAGAVRA